MGGASHPILNTKLGDKSIMKYIRILVALAGEAADIVTQERIENFQQLAGKR